MGQIREAGRTLVSVPASGPAGPPQNTLFQAVRSFAGDEFEILGELGRGAKGSIVYLARDRNDQSLVALRLEEGPDPNEYVLDVVEQLDSRIPAIPGVCPMSGCGASLRAWGRFCPGCGADLSGLGSTGGSMTQADLLRAVQETAKGLYEVLGLMSRAEGGGFVYFARHIRTGELAALRLQRKGEADYELGVTAMMSSLVDRLDGGPPARPTPTAAAAPAFAPVPPPTPDPVVPPRSTPHHAESKTPLDGQREWTTSEKVLVGIGTLVSVLLILNLLVMLAD